VWPSKTSSDLISEQKSSSSGEEDVGRQPWPTIWKISKTEHVFKLMIKKLKIIHMPNAITVDWVAILICISDILGSNFCPQPDYADWIVPFDFS